MDLDTALATLRSSEPTLRSMGVQHVAVFGSVARGSSASGSDLDVMIELDPLARISVYDYVGIKSYIAGLFGGVPVDVVNRNSLKPHIQPAAIADADYAF